MKTIIVATDFSKPAINAAIYALHMAKYLKSNITLCHAFFIPADIAAIGHVWPVYNYGSLLDDASELLDTFANELMQKGKSLNTPNTFKPIVEYIAESSRTVQLVNRLADKTQAGLVVLGMSGAGAVTKFLMGSTSRALIENAGLPVLLIPPGYLFRPINKIAFATDLNSSDIEIVRSLAGFARYFKAELAVVHVNQDAEEYNPKKADIFLNEVTSKMDYDKIYYREIASSNVNDGLEWLSTYGKIDMLVMVHRHNGFIDRLLKGSFTKRQASRVKMPLLVLSEGIIPEF